MRKSIKVLIAVFLCLAVVKVVSAQDVIPFKKLQEFLPKIEIPDYVKKNPTGQSTKAMGVSTSEAGLTYEKQKPDGDTLTITVTIQDLKGIPFAQMGMSMMGLTEYENETDTGYEKSIKVQGFAGTETVDRGEYPNAEIVIMVGGRFSVTLKNEGVGDAAVLHLLLGKMNLAELAKLGQ